jgi:hypothetical protein
MRWREDSISGQTLDSKFQIPNSKLVIGKYCNWLFVGVIASGRVMGKTVPALIRA